MSKKIPYIYWIDIGFCHMHGLAVAEQILNLGFVQKDKGNGFVQEWSSSSVHNAAVGT